MSVYDEVTQAIIAELEQGVPPWVKSWQSHLPRNFISRKEYRGVNVILLWVVANKKGYRSPYWLTFKQAGELKGKIRKGEKATGIVYAATVATTQVLELVEESVTRAPPHLEPIVPNSGNGLRTKPFARLHGLEKCMADPRLG